MTAARDWRDRAACRDLVTAEDDPWFAGTEEAEQRALAICAGCPVKVACLDFAVRTGQQYGIWGGRREQTIRRLAARCRQGRALPDRTGSHWNAIKSRCKNGHAFDAANTYYAPDGRRHCRACFREIQAAAAQRAQERSRARETAAAHPKGGAQRA
jgi:WhiB family redox-sensing transcriptional regulator